MMMMIIIIIIIIIIITTTIIVVIPITIIRIILVMEKGEIEKSVRIKLPDGKVVKSFGR